MIHEAVGVSSIHILMPHNGTPYCIQFTGAKIAEAHGRQAVDAMITGKVPGAHILDGPCDGGHLVHAQPAGKHLVISTFMM